MHTQARQQSGIAPVRYVVLAHLYVDVKRAFPAVDCPIGHDVLAEITLNVVRFSLAIDVLLELHKILWLPALRFRINEACEMVIEYLANDPSDASAYL